MVGSSIMRTLRMHGYKRIFSPLRKDLNLLDNFEVKNWFDNHNPDIVILAAAKVGGIFANNEYPADFIMQNIKIQTNVIETSFEKNIKKFLFLGVVVFIQNSHRNQLKKKSY